MTSLAFPTDQREQILTRKGYARIAGCDEAGRGPLAGPVVAAVVVWTPGISWPGVHDSKQLTELERERLFDQIVQSTATGIGMASHEEVDQINILQATLLAMKRAWQELLISPDYTLIDGRWGRLPFPGEGLVGGDALSVSIAAASILAKVTRDRWMLHIDPQYPQYGFARHKGYGTQMHRDAIRSFGRCPIHRKSFSSIADAQPVETFS